MEQVSKPLIRVGLDNVVSEKENKKTCGTKKVTAITVFDATKKIKRSMVHRRDNCS